MNIKKTYQIGDTVWVYGIDSNSNKSREGTVIKFFNIDRFDPVYYVISIPCEIEPLLEIRTWETISQDSKGPVGAIRDAFNDAAVSKKVLARGGLMIDAAVPLGSTVIPKHKNRRRIKK